MKKFLLFFLFTFILFPIFSDSLHEVSLSEVDLCKYFSLPKNTTPSLQLISLVHNFKYNKNPYKVYSVENIKYKIMIDKTISEYAKTKSVELVSQLSLKEKIGKIFIIPVEGKTFLSENTKSRFNNIKPGGVLLFGYNIADTPIETQFFINQISTENSALTSPESEIFSPLIFIDHEGGWVNRLRKLAAPLPSASFLFSSLTNTQLSNLYALTAFQLSLLGIQINLSPVAEFTTEDNADFLDSRSVSDDPKIVARFSKLVVEAFQNAGVGAVLKHFPGNGKGDPHFMMPKISESESKILSDYLYPFKKSNEAKPIGVLMSLVKVSSIDDTLPACLSPKIVGDLLKQKVGFEKIVISDDLSMGAISAEGFSTSEAIVKALKAGCDMIMISNFDFEEFYNAINNAINNNEISNENLTSSCSKILEAQILYGYKSVLPIRKLFFTFNQEEKANAFNLCKTAAFSYLQENSTNGVTE